MRSPSHWRGVALALLGGAAALSLAACKPGGEKAAEAGVDPAAGAPTEQQARLSGGRPKFGPPPGMMEFQQVCASCHTKEGMKMGARAVPSIASLGAMPPESILLSMTSGKMQSQASSLSDAQKKSVAEFLAGRKIIDVEGASVAKMSNKCATNPPLGDINQASWNGWGAGTNNARFQNAANAGLDASKAPKLKLKWAFGLPGGGSSISQPTVAGGRVFVGSDNTAVYSIDAKTGCAYWSFFADAPGRFAPIVAPISGHGASKHAVFFTTARGTSYAVDAQSGQQLWKTELPGPANVSNTAAYHNGRLYVPLTGSETVAGSNPQYECCKSRGAIVAVDANTGKVVWKAESIPEPLRKLGKNPAGKQLWGPSGASIWNTPTVDPKRGVLYVGTGNSFGPIAADTSDSILAFRLSDGKLLWHHQEIKGDAFMLGCENTNKPGGNCPEKLGPDWDFGGSSVILQTLPGGRDILLAAGKAGIAIALDPDQKGKIVWRTQLWEKTPPTADGLVIFGGAADGQHVYYPMQQEGGGLTALDIATGKRAWIASLKTDPRGQIGPASAISGLVFTGGWDGVLRAVDAKGKVVWSYATRKDFQTVNGVQAKGGSLGSPGPTIAGGMVYVASGYIGMQNGYPGNVVLAFAPE